MKPAAFDIVRPETQPALADALGDSNRNSKIMAGGQSLGPMMNLRLARPDLLIDVTGLDGLCDARQTETHVEIGAAVTHARIEDGDCPDPVPGMLRHVARGIAYRAVRNRGTIGGSLCHADPAADWVTAMTALGATLVAREPSGAAREIPMESFMLGAYRTALRHDEVLTAVRIPRFSAGAVWGYYKICRKVGEFAEAISAFVADPEKRVCRVVFGSTGGAPYVSPDLARHLAEAGAAAPLDVIRTELAVALPGLSEIKIHQLAIAHRRAVEEALAVGGAAR